MTGMTARKTPLVVVGDALLDRDLTGTADRLAPDAPVPVVADCAERLRPGGAALTAYLAARDGRPVTLIAGVGDDEASRALVQLLGDHVEVIPLPLTGALAEKTRVLARGRPVVRLDAGSGRVAAATDAAREALRRAPAVLVSDYGRGAADAVRDLLAERPPLVWDPHPRGGPPVPGTRLVTPAEKEAQALTGEPEGLRGAARGAARLVKRWRVGAVAVTLGPRGALLSYGDHPLLVPAPAAHAGDPCGAGDRFSGAAAALLADGTLIGEAVEGAVRAATEFVGAGGAGAALRTPLHRRPVDDPRALIADVRARHGTVVAAGGCFDLLHAGHVGLLQAARRLGDCLVVCVNSDASVRRRKGAGRPVSPLADRVRVLRALSCVDAVAVFDENTPERLLSDLRPDIWVKGGDYAGADLPEAALLQQWGGQAVLLPYLAGRSSTALIERAAEGVSAGPARPSGETSAPGEGEGAGDRDSAEGPSRSGRPGTARPAAGAPGPGKAQVAADGGAGSRVVESASGGNAETAGTAVPAADGAAGRAEGPSRGGRPGTARPAAGAPGRGKAQVAADGGAGSRVVESASGGNAETAGTAVPAADGAAGRAEGPSRGGRPGTARPAAGAPGRGKAQVAADGGAGSRVVESASGGNAETAGTAVPAADGAAGRAEARGSDAGGDRMGAEEASRGRGGVGRVW